MPYDPQTLIDMENEYNRLTSQYDKLREPYEASVRNLDYSRQAYDRSGTMWNQLEGERNTDRGYGSNRFYMGGEIYKYDPQAQTYRGSISGNIVNQPSDYVAPELAQNPGVYSQFMAEDPYYQLLQDTSNSQSPNYTAPAPKVQEGARPPRPHHIPSQGSNWTYIWDSDKGEWVWGPFNPANRAKMRELTGLGTVYGSQGSGSDPAGGRGGGSSGPGTGSHR